MTTVRTLNTTHDYSTNLMNMALMEFKAHRVRELAWVRVVMKMCHFMQMTEIIHRSQVVLNQPNLNKWARSFGIEAKTTEKSTEPAIDLTEPVRYRELKGEIMGRMLGQSQGPQDITNQKKDPILCQHPVEAMKRRGNKDKKL